MRKYALGPMRAKLLGAALISVAVAACGGSPAPRPPAPTPTPAAHRASPPLTGTRAPARPRPVGLLADSLGRQPAADRLHDGLVVVGRRQLAGGQRHPALLLAYAGRLLPHLDRELELLAGALGRDGLPPVDRSGAGREP